MASHRITVAVALLLLTQSCTAEESRSEVLEQSRAPLSTVELALDDARIPSPAGGTQTMPALAYDGTQYLAAWVDTRELGPSKIRVTRLSPQGAVLDLGSLAASTGVNDAWDPKIAAGGGIFYVAWFERTPALEGFIFTRRLSAAGAWLDPAPVPVPSVGPHSLARMVSVGYAAGVFLIVFEDNKDIRAERRNAMGQLLGARFDVSAAAGSQRTPSVASNGTGFWVVWEDARDITDNEILGTAVSTNGVVTAPAGAVVVSTSGDDNRPSLAHGGGSYFAVWDRTTVNGAGVQDGLVGRLSASGVVSGEQSYSGGVNIPAGIGGSPAGVLVAANKSILRLNSAGSKIDASPVPVPLEGNCGVASDGTEYLVACGAQKLGATRVSTTAPVQSPTRLPVATSYPHQTQLSVAVGGGVALAVWRDERSGNGDVYGVRLARDGARMDPVAFALSAGPGDDSTPNVWFDGTHFQVVWESWSAPTTTSTLWTVRMAPDAAPVPPSPVLIDSSTSDRGPLVTASSGDTTLVAWLGNRAGTWGIYGTRIRAGQLLDASAVLLTAASPSNHFSPAAMTTPGGYVLSWTEPVPMRIRTRALTANLMPVGPAATLAVAGIPRAQNLAFDGRDVLLFTETELPDGGRPLRGERLAATTGDFLSDAGAVLSTDGHSSSALTVAGGVRLAFVEGGRLRTPRLNTGSWSLLPDEVDAPLTGHGFTAQASDGVSTVVAYSRFVSDGQSYSAFGRWVGSAALADGGVPGSLDGGTSADGGTGPGGALDPSQLLQFSIGCGSAGGAHAAWLGALLVLLRVGVWRARATRSSDRLRQTAPSAHVGYP